MLALALDTVAAYLLSRHIEKLWLAALLALCAGVGSAIVANMLMYAFASDMFTPGEVMIHIISGSVWHPLITFAGLLLFRRKVSHEAASVNRAEESSHSALVTDLDSFVISLASSPSDLEIREDAKSLLDVGYDRDSLIDLVRERAGIEAAFLVQRALAE